MCGAEWNVKTFAAFIWVDILIAVVKSNELE